MALFAGMVSCYFTHTFNWWVCVIIGYGNGPGASATEIALD